MQDNAFFRWIEERFDTPGMQGKFTQKVLSTAADIERALIRKRTSPGLASGRAAASGLSGPAGASGRELGPVRPLPAPRHAIGGSAADDQCTLPQSAVVAADLASRAVNMLLNRANTLGMLQVGQ